VRRVPALATIWQNHNFVLLLSGQIVSLAGTGASQLALPLLVLWLTRSPVQAAVDGALYVLPYAVLCLPAGALVDRWDRKRVMIGCDVARAALLLSIPLAAALGCLTIWLLYGLALVQGTLFCFFDLAATASLLRVASRKHLATASSTYTAAVNGAQLFGPSLGGFLYSVGRTVPFLADAVSYAVSALSLFWIQVSFQEERTEEFDQPLRKEITDGLTWLWHHSLLRSLAIVSGSANLVLAAFPLVLILLAQRLHASAPLTGVVLTGAGAGGVLGSLVYLRLQRSVGFGRLFLGGLGLALLMWLAAAVAPTPLFLAAVALCAMASEQVSSVAQYTVRLALIPDHLRGRVNSAYRLLLMLTQPIGIAGVGLLVQEMGTGPTILVCALVLGITLAAGLGLLHSEL
jgi:MFS family permease